MVSATQGGGGAGVKFLLSTHYLVGLIIRGGGVATTLHKRARLVVCGE